jgi:predicted transcriptional regulator
MDPNTHAPLSSEIEQFLVESGMSPTAFGRDALNDPGFVFGIRTGRDCRLSTVERARLQIRRYRETGEFEPRHLNGRPPEAAAE